MGMSASSVEVRGCLSDIVQEAESSQGKVLRDGQGQASNRSDEEVLDLVITNALVIDWSGIFKAGPPLSRLGSLT